MGTGRHASSAPQGLPFARAFAFSARPSRCLGLRFATHAAKSLIESLAASGRQPVRKIGHEGLDDLAGGIINSLDIVKVGDLIVYSIWAERRALGRNTIHADQRAFVRRGSATTLPC